MIRDKILKLIANAEIREALQLLKKYFSGKNEVIHKLISLEGQLSKVNQDFLNGILTYEFEVTQVNRISSALLEISTLIDDFIKVDADIKNYTESFLQKEGLSIQNKIEQNAGNQSTSQTNTSTHNSQVIVNAADAKRVASETILLEQLKKDHKSLESGIYAKLNDIENLVKENSNESYKEKDILEKKY